MASGCAGHDEGEKQQGSGESLKQAQQEVRDGTDDNDNFFPFVGRWSNPNIGGFCSGTLITPTWFLTAGHCVTGTDPVGPGSPPGANTIQNSINGNYTIFFGVQPGTGPFARHTFRLGGNTPVIGNILQVVYPNGRNNPLAARKSTPYSFNYVTDSDSYRDVALIQLDQRIPIFSIQPLHPAVQDSEYCGDDYGAFVVGYGRKTIFTDQASQPRNFRFSSGWSVDNKGAGERIVTNTWFTTLISTDYAGNLPGDSGGALLRSDTSLSPPFRLCGVNSAYGVVPQFFNPIDPSPFYSDMANINSPNNRSFLQSRGVIDQAGRFVGECLPGELKGTPDDDTDSDFDLIPDSCDPCRFVPDPEYRFTGAFSLKDSDQDGIPDACDNCPLTDSANLNDSDDDGLGDVCDVAQSPGFDLGCCTSDQECPGVGNECIPFGTWVPGQQPAASGAAYCFNRGESRCALPLDSDGDKVADHVDNCPITANPSQSDSDGDGIGTDCDRCTLSSFPKNLRDTDTFLSLSATITKESVECNPTHNGDLSGKSADQFCFLKHALKESKCIRNPLSSKGGFCSEGPDSDLDGVGDACDNCKDVPNKFQDNCNAEMEFTQNLSTILAGNVSSLVGDACDPIPCAYLRPSPDQSPQTPEGGQLVSASPILLPSTAPNAIQQTGATLNTSIGLRFCPCGNRDGEDRVPLVCASALEGDCAISGALFNATGNNRWLPPSFRPVGSASEVWDDNAIPTSNPASLIANRPFANASPLEYPDQKLPATVAPGLAQWDATRWQSAPAGMVGSFTTPGQEVCDAGIGVQGVLWSSLRLTNGLIPPVPLEDPSSHYAYDRWGTMSVCGPNPGTINPGQTKKLLCDWCPPGDFLGASELWIYVNPDPNEDWSILANDGIRTRPVADLPRQLGEPWINPGTRWVVASDAEPNREQGLAVMAAVQPDGRNLVSALGFDRGRLFPVGGRIVRGEDEPTAGTADLLQAQETSPQPSSRQDFALALSAKRNTLFLVSGKGPSGWNKDLWRFHIPSQEWFEVPLDKIRPERPLAVTYSGFSGSLYIVDEQKTFGLPLARLLRINPETGESEVLGWWPRAKAFDTHFLSVGPDGELVLGASSSKGKGHHAVVTFREKDGKIQVLWGLVGVGDLGGAPTLTRDGLTRPFSSPSFLNQRFLPQKSLPKKGGMLLGGCF